MDIKWSGDAELRKKLQYIGDNIDKKVSYHLNGFAYKANTAVRAELPQWLNMTKGKRWLTSNWLYEKSTPDNLSITVGASEDLRLAPLLEDGGTRTPLRRAITIKEQGRFKNATDARNAAGAFSGTIGTVAGIWQRQKKRKGSTLKLLYSYHDKADYRGNNTNFYEFIQDFVGKNLDNTLEIAVNELIDRAATK